MRMKLCMHSMQYNIYAATHARCIRTVVVSSIMLRVVYFKPGGLPCASLILVDRVHVLLAGCTGK